MPLRRALAVLLLAVSVAPSLARAGQAPGPQCKTLGGPCRQVAMTSALFRPPGAELAPGGSDLAIVANFGVLVSADKGKSWQFVCEETFGRGAMDRLQLHPDGRLLAPGGDGFYVSVDGCGFTTANGSVAGKFVWDVAVEPGKPGRVWALSGQIGEPRVLHLSTDGSRTFSMHTPFDSKLRLHRILIAPSDAKRIYVAGYGEKVAMVIARSDDGGETFKVDDSGSGFTDPARTVDYIGVDPHAPDTLYIAVADPNTGDHIYRSNDGGKSWTRLLTMESAELKTGFAFGRDGTLFAAGRSVFELGDMPTAHLYVSHDSGKTWYALPSGQQGPRYRCLAYEGDRLYTCADDEPGGDPFLLGVSTDEGKNWEPVVRLSQVKGAKSCAFEACAVTATWLCEAHGACSPEQMQPSRADAGAARDGARDGPATGNGGGGCGCRAAGARARGRASGAAAILPMILVGARASRRGLRRRRTTA